MSYTVVKVVASEGRGFRELFYGNWSSKAVVIEEESAFSYDSLRELGGDDTVRYIMRINAGLCAAMMSAAVLIRLAKANARIILSNNVDEDLQIEAAKQGILWLKVNTSLLSQGGIAGINLETGELDVGGTLVKFYLSEAARELYVLHRDLVLA